jgi:radical SAM protein with 4Fe4S-binding SPASM domain
VYACPFAIHEEFLAVNVTEPGGFAGVWRTSSLFESLRAPTSGGSCGTCEHYGTCRGGCMAAKFFTGLPLDGPDPECVQGYGVDALLARGDTRGPKASLDHSHRQAPRPPAARASRPVALTLGRGPRPVPVSACQESPLAGFDPESA